MATRPSGATTKFAFQNSPFDLVDLNPSVGSPTHITVRQEPHPPRYHAGLMEPGANAYRLMLLALSVTIIRIVLRLKAA